MCRWKVPSNRLVYIICILIFTIFSVVYTALYHYCSLGIHVLWCIIYISCYSQYLCIIWYLKFHTKSIFFSFSIFYLSTETWQAVRLALSDIFWCTLLQLQTESLNLFCLLTVQSFNCKWKWHLWRNSCVYVLKVVSSLCTFQVYLTAAVPNLLLLLLLLFPTNRLIDHYTMRV